MKYSKTIQNNPKFEQEVSNNVGSIHKKIEAKKTKKKQSSSALSRTRGRDPSPSARHTGTQGRPTGRSILPAAARLLWPAQ
jgi:hypothetical protein